jgi:glycosyltransferase involved in cell wall biosynthesis
LRQTLPELHVIWHPHNAGYGANQKTCYLHALNAGADVVVMLHPDGQYEPTLIPDLIAPILAGEADLVLGSRLAVPGAAIAGGMPRWKWLANRALTSPRTGSCTPTCPSCTRATAPTRASCC